MNKSIIIIGARMGGLSADCYGQMNGYPADARTPSPYVAPMKME